MAKCSKRFQSRRTERTAPVSGKHGTRGGCAAYRWHGDSCQQTASVPIARVHAPPIPWNKLWDDVKFSVEHLSDITHVAVVADQGWIGAYVNMLNPLMKAELKHFKRPELEVARSWLAQAV